MQGHPPGKSSVPRESLLKRIICDLLTDALVLTQVLHEATYYIIIRYTYKFCPRTSVCHMSSDLPMQLQPRTTWKKTDAQSGWKGSPSGVGQMRVGSSRSRSTPAAISPTFALVGSSTPTYSPLLSAALTSFDAFWILRGAAPLDISLDFSSYPSLSTGKEQCSSWVPSQEDHFGFFVRRSGVFSSAACSNILHHHLVHMQAFLPVLHFVTWVQIFQCDFSKAPREQ